MNIPEGKLYTKTHEWIEFLEEGRARVGLTDHAQHALGDLVYVGLPEIGSQLEQNEIVADVESVKAASEIYAPVAGVICLVNEVLLDEPEKINDDPYGAWIFELDEIAGREGLLSASEYAECIQGEEE